jgi:magnesium transporter
MTYYKRNVLQIRRVLAPQREVVNKLARDPYLVVGEKDQVYFRDVYDHMVRLTNDSDSVRDLLTGNMELYLSVVNNRMNDIMKTLTIITTLFMPLTFITGFFGMNFFQAVLPSRFWTGPVILVLTLVIMVLLPLVMFYWMRRRAWM